MKIGKKQIGNGAPVFIIAELSANHRQNYDIAEKSLIAAAEAGADAVKLQTYTPDTITIDCGSELFRLPGNSLWAGKTLYELYGEAYTPWEWHPKLKNLADSLGIEFFSSPFDHTAVDFLETLNVPAYKIASFEMVDIPLIRKAAATGKPIILSTGMADYPEIEEAIEACKSTGNNDIILLKCTSAYPAPIEQANLCMIEYFKREFGVPAGLSDHTEGIAAPIIATALGADVIEKHFILDKSLGGPDAEFSLDKNDFTAMVRAVRDAEKAKGSVSFEKAENVRAMRRLGRSLFAVQDIPAGGAITEANVRSIRPGMGLHPRHLYEIMGKKVKNAVKKGTPISWELFE